MNKAMRVYKVVENKPEEHSFVKTKRGEAYAYKGYVKTYANRTQAENGCKKLKELGIDTFVSFSHPFLLIKEA